MEEDKEIEAILICGDADAPVPGSVLENCADCGKGILRKPDPEVPEDAIKLCMDCAMVRMGAERDAGHPPVITITTQNKQLLDKLGVTLKADGSC